MRPHHLALALCAALACGDKDGPTAPAGDGDGDSDRDDAGTDAGDGVDAAVEPVADAAPRCPPDGSQELALEPVVSGLAQPVLVTAPAGDPRLFVIEKPGRVRIVAGGALVPEPFLDIADQVHDTGGEQGLLGLAFHPDYADNGRFYLNYTAAEPRGATVVAAYQVSADADVALTGETRLLTVEQPYGNHNGGMLAFGPDGYLYIGMGDGGSGGDPLGHGQNPATLLGAMLRIDVDGASPYAIPADNPYAGSAGAEKQEIWALGVRNPWRFSFDRDSGDLYIGDVGQGEREEIDVQPAGAGGGQNYGWNTMEGSQCFGEAGCDQSGLVLPVHDYSHGGGRCSVTGGYVYRGSALPAQRGRYFFADYCSSQVWSFAYAGGAATDVREHSCDLDPSGTLLPRGDGISSFGEDGAGELYLTLLDSGTVYRLVAEP